MACKISRKPYFSSSHLPWFHRWPDWELIYIFQGLDGQDGNIKKILTLLAIRSIDLNRMELL